MQELSQEEFDERVAILRRLKTLLESQREKFREYLHLLESQEEKIENDDSDTLIACSELGTHILTQIGSLQKVIVPLQELYEKSFSPSFLSSTERKVSFSDKTDVERIQEDLTKLQGEVLAQNERNRTKLKIHLFALRKQIADFRNPYRSLSSIYAQKTNSSGTRIRVEV